MQVYVSSTSVDLKEHRAAVIGALRKMQYTPVCMEDYVAQDVLPVEKCLSDVAKSDVYVGIFAWRYGFVPPGYDKSITELEYRKAVDAGIPVLFFILAEETPWPEECKDTGERMQNIVRLREELKLKKMVSFFTNPYHLASEVQSAVSQVFMQKLMENRYAEVSLSRNSEQADSVERAVTLLQEAMQQQSRHAEQMTYEPIPINLPRLHGTFVDREIECDTLRHCLHDEDMKMVVIVAPGGYGKTEMTTKVLKEFAPSTTIVDDQIKGILYLRCIKGDVSLGQIFSDAGRIAGKTEEFRQIYANREMTLERKLDYLFRELSKVGKVWVVMDNFEDLLDQTNDAIIDTELRQFLEVAVATEHNVRLVITSRAVPRFEGSRKVAKIDLSNGLPKDQAVRYLREEGADYGLDKESDEVLLAFVRRVHCIPKALESVLGYLEDHYPGIKLKDLLADDTLFSDFDRHDIEKGLKKLIAQQLEKQSADAQLVLSALSIFPKPVPEAALRYILPGIESVEFAAILARLERNRLLSQHHGIYDLHPIVRTFLYDRLPVGDSTAELVDSSTVAPASGLTRIILHARAAKFFHALRIPKEELKAVEDLGAYLQEFHHLVNSGGNDSAARLLEVIDYDYLMHWGCYSTFIAMGEQLREVLSHKGLRGHLLCHLGCAYKDIGRLGEALECLEQSLGCYESVDNLLGVRATLGNMGNTLVSLNDLARAEDCLRRALVLARESDDREDESNALGALGNVFNRRGNSDEAVKYWNNALAICRETDDKLGEATWLANIGSHLEDAGDILTAIDYYNIALSIEVDAGFRHGEITTLCRLGYARRLISEVRSGIVCFEKALAIARDTDMQNLACRALVGLGHAHCEIGDLEKATEFFNESQQCLRYLSDDECASAVMGLSCALNIIAGDLKSSLEYYQVALTNSRSRSLPKEEGMYLSLLGGTRVHSGDFADALGYYLDALKMSRIYNYSNIISYRLKGLAYCHHHLNQLAQARSEYTESFNLNIPDTKAECAILLGVLYLEQNDAQSAKHYLESGIALCNEDIEKTPELYARLYKLAIAQLANEQYAESITNYHRALDVCSAKGILCSVLQDLALLERASPATLGLKEVRELLEARSKNYD